MPQEVSAEHLPLLQRLPASQATQASPPRPQVPAVVIEACTGTQVPSAAQQPLQVCELQRAGAAGELQPASTTTATQLTHHNETPQVLIFASIGCLRSLNKSTSCFAGAR